jgi:hypothetical protein
MLCSTLEMIELAAYESNYIWFLTLDMILVSL